MRVVEIRILRRVAELKSGIGIRNEVIRRKLVVETAIGR